MFSPKLVDPDELVRMLRQHTERRELDLKQSPSNKRDMKTMKTMIVADDDEMFRMIMRRHLGAMGFEVIEDDSGKAVVAQIGQYRPVACLIDIVMGEKDGIETMTEIAELPRRPKVIAVSSNAFYLELASELGADATLQKPIALATLKATLDRLEIRPD